MHSYSLTVRNITQLEPANSDAIYVCKNVLDKYCAYNGMPYNWTDAKSLCWTDAAICSNMNNKKDLRFRHSE